MADTRYSKKKEEKDFMIQKGLALSVTIL